MFFVLPGKSEQVIDLPLVGLVTPVVNPGQIVGHRKVFIQFINLIET